MMIMEGQGYYHKGRTPNKVAALKRFAKQWNEYAAEIQDENCLEYKGDDVEYVANALYLDTTMDKFDSIADAMDA